MSTNFYFNNFNQSQEQDLIESLIIESIKIYGINVLYMPRTLVKEDHLFGEDVLSTFDDAYTLEMYIKSVDGFDGDGDFLSKFNLEIRDEVTLTVSRRRFGEEVVDDDTTPVNEMPGIARPSEGDLIFFPVNGKIFEVKFVEHEALFYPMGALQTFELRCELFEYSHEEFNTGIDIIDNIEDEFSGNSLDFQLLAENGDTLIMEDGLLIVNEEYRIEDTDLAANNEFFDSERARIDFIDFSEINPFSESGTW